MINLSESATFILMVMFEQIAELSKLKFDQLVIKASFFNLSAMVQKLFNRMRIQAEFQSLNMHLHIDQTIPKLVKTDKDKLERMLFSLLQNALKFTTRGHIKLLV